MAACGSQPELRARFGAGVHRALVANFQNKGADRAWKVTLATPDREGLLPAWRAGGRQADLP